MRSVYKLSFLLLLCLFINTAANAKEVCDKTITDVVGKHFKITNFWMPNYSGVLRGEDRGGVIVSGECVLWPYNKNIALAAYAFKPGLAGKQKDSEENLLEQKNLIVVMVDKSKQGVVSSFQSVITEDAITEVGNDSLQIDTARYQLTPTVRAFGVRFNSVAIGASCGEANWNNELTLYVPDGKKLHPVFRRNMYQQQSIKGCLSTQWPGAVWEDANLTISIEKSHTKGYADLLLTAKIEHFADDGAEETNRGGKARIEHYLLRYDGNTYVKGADAPWWIRW